MKLSHSTNSLISMSNNLTVSNSSMLLYSPYDEEFLVDFKLKLRRIRGEQIFSITEATFEGCAAKLALSNYRLQIFPDADHDFRAEKLEIPLGVIDVAEASSGQLCLYCKDFREVRFANVRDLEPFAKRLNYFRQLPFVLHKPVKSGKVKAALFDLDKELKRQKVPLELWEKFHNEGFKFSPTYPRHFIIPAKLSEEVLRKTAEFRSSKRIPVLVYYNQNGASLTRCSQPKVGVFGQRSEHDERMVRAIREANPTNKILQIIDCRAKIAAWANNVKGAGTENIANYNFCELSFMDIGNIHTMRSSLSGLFELVKREIQHNSYGAWFYGIAKTGWFDHIFLLLSCAVSIVEMIDKDKSSVMVHCSDGWDRTPQVCSLVQLLLDPYYRTIEGFEVLIEKDWVSFGHKFKDRTNSEKSGFWTEHESSPIFLQFMDCVFQIFTQFPHLFEFNEQFLIAILDHLYSNRFSTFIGNNECHREEIFREHELRREAESLWRYLNHSERLGRFRNKLYDRKNTQRVIYPTYIQSCLQFWRSYYMRYYIYDVDVLRQRTVEVRQEPLHIHKRRGNSGGNGDNFFNFSLGAEEERHTFVGTKLNLKPECQNVRLLDNYEKEDGEEFPLIPLVAKESGPCENSQATYLSSVYSGVSTVYSGVCSGFSGLSSWWSKPVHNK